MVRSIGSDNPGIEGLTRLMTPEVGSPDVAGRDGAAGPMAGGTRRLVLMSSDDRAERPMHDHEADLRRDTGRDAAAETERRCPTADADTDADPLLPLLERWEQ